MWSEYKLENWAVVATPNNPYVPPEAKINCLSGKCPERAMELNYKYPPELQESLKEKTFVTSPIIKIEGRCITTRSGSVYILGEVDPEYVKFVHGLGKELDSENPIYWITHK